MIVQEQDVQHGGCKVSWKPKPTLEAPVREIMTSLGVENFCPPPYSVGEALKRAAVDYARAHRTELLDGLENRTNISLKVQRHEKAEHDGYEVIAVEHGKERNQYPQLFGVKVNGSETPEVTFGWSLVSSEWEILEAYKANRKTIAASAISQMIVAIIKALNGTSVDEDGRYYLPKGVTPAFEEFVDGLESVSQTKITVDQIIMTASSARSILDGITKELTESSNKVYSEVTEEEMGKRALENRIKSLDDLSDKCETYEGILDSPLQDIRAALKKAKDAAKLAHMLAINENVSA